MNSRIIILVLSILALIVIGMFSYTFIARKAVAPNVTDTEVTEKAGSQLSYDVKRIDAKHFYVDNKHTIVGEIMMPTPCDLLTYEAKVAESMPEQVSFDFNVINDADTCAQVMTPQRFSVSAKASKEAVLKATFLGKSVELNLVEALPGETPDDFELYIKG